MKALIRRIRENKYLTRNETDFIIKALEENSSLRKQVNMWQSEHAKRVLELGKLREGIKLTREEIEDKAFTEEIFDEDIFNSTNTESVSRETAECESYVETEVVRLSDILEILDELIESEEEER